MSQRDLSHDAPAPIEISSALSHLFASLQPAAVEQFYQSYQLWLLQQRLELLHTQITTVRQQISDNETRMRQVQPSSVALAVLVRLQSHGVNDIALLEQMLAKGEEWLDDTMQLLDLCEQLGMLHNDYATWCEHALEGAYNWVASMQAGEKPRETITTSADEQGADAVTTEHITEEMLLQKLMSEQDEETLELAIVHSQHPVTPLENTPAISQEAAVSIVEFEEESPLDLPVDNVITTQAEIDEQHIDVPLDEEAVHDETDVQPKVALLIEEAVAQVETQATQPEIESVAEDASAQEELEQVQAEGVAETEAVAGQIAIIAPDELELPSLSSQSEPLEEILDEPTERRVDAQDTREQSAVMAVASLRVSTEHSQQKRARKRGLFGFLFSLILRTW